MPRCTVLLALVACSTRTPTARERSLAQLPATAELVAAANGPALATQSFRKLVDVARPHAPTKLGCVIDAALTSEAAALAFEPGVGTTIVIITRAVVASCPALSRIADDTYVATIGSGAIAPRAKSVLIDPRWARARRYLARDPIAIAADGDSRHVLAVAQPAPLDAWVTIDAIDSAALERDARAFTARWTNVRITRAANQLSVRADKLDDDELLAIVTELLRVADAPPGVQSAGFDCPQHGVVSCHDGTHVVVQSVANTLRTLSNANAEPFVENGQVIGVQVLNDAGVLLRRGDIIIGLDSQRITQISQLRDLASRLQVDRAALAVRRGTKDAVIDLRE